ncbi:MAG: hypothetical protein [Olavius algarvensis Gamma 1 endosymbiont]|nr:MAG: hypothetical protein [Olavius algarvensis Gamma 1 endosymbiont]
MGRHIRSGHVIRACPVSPTNRNESNEKSCSSCYTLLIPIFRFFIQPMSSKLFVSKERNSR